VVSELNLHLGFLFGPEYIPVGIQRELVANPQATTGIAIALMQKIRSCWPVVSSFNRKSAELQGSG